MPFNGSGTYTFPAGSFNPAVNGANATAADWDALLADLATAVSKMIARDGQSTITGNTPWATFRITGLGDPVAAQDAATKNYVQSTPRSYLAGFGLSNDGVTPNTILDIAAGFCLDSTNATGIPGAAFTKSTGGSWAAGSGGNGMGNGLTIANTTWYHVFAIINAGAYDVYFDTSATAANKPASTTAFRRLGSVLTDSSAHIVAFIQIGDRFYWLTPVADVNATSTGTLAVTRTLTVPTGIIVFPIMNCVVTETSGASELVYLSALSQTDVAASSSNAQVAIFAGGNSAQTAAEVSNVATNTSAQIRSRAATGSSSTIFNINTVGWRESRGRDN